MENLEELKAKKEELASEMKAIRAKIKAERSKVYSKEYAKSKYATNEEYRKRQNDNAKARYYRLKQQRLEEDKKID